MSDGMRTADALPDLAQARLLLRRAFDCEHAEDMRNYVELVMVKLGAQRRESPPETDGWRGLDAARQELVRSRCQAVEMATERDAYRHDVRNLNAALRKLRVSAEEAHRNLPQNPVHARNTLGAALCKTTDCAGDHSTTRNVNIMSGDNPCESSPERMPATTPLPDGSSPKTGRGSSSSDTTAGTSTSESETPSPAPAPAPSSCADASSDDHRRVSDLLERWRVDSAFCFMVRGQLAKLLAEVRAETIEACIEVASEHLLRGRAGSDAQRIIVGRLVMLRAGQSGEKP